MVTLVYNKLQSVCYLINQELLNLNMYFLQYLLKIQRTKQKLAQNQI